MKTSVAVISAIFLTVSCNLLEPGLSLGEPRLNGHGRAADARPQDVKVKAAGDTVFLVSAVSFPKSYDWQRDSAFGSVACTLKLFRNGKCILDLPAGSKTSIGVAPDMHHFIGSALFTEYSDYSGTVVTKDGELLARWPEPEKLLGLLYKDGTLYSLGLSRSGESITYRQNGQIVLMASDAVAIGGFGADTYGRQGALYEDEGHVCFAYKTLWDKQQQVFFVRDGEIYKRSSLQEADILDARLMHGRPLVLYNLFERSFLHDGERPRPLSSTLNRVWVEGGLLEYLGGIAVAGFFRDRQNNLRAGLCQDECFAVLEDDTSHIYCDGEYVLGMSAPPDYYFFHRNCAFQLGDKLARIMTPKDSGGAAYFEYGSNKTEFNLHGYLSGVTAILTESDAD